MTESIGESSKVLNIFSRIAKGIQAEPEMVRSVNATYLFRISGPEGGIFHVDLKNNPGISFEEKSAECILDVCDRDFMKLVKGVLPGYKAMLNGKLKVKGDLALATRLNEIFRAARSQKKE